MKKILILIVALNALLVLLLAGLFVLTETYPLRPGGPLYDVQHTAEQTRLHLSSDEARRAAYALDLAERRLADVAAAAEPERIDAAVITFDRALNEVIVRIDAVPSGIQEDLDDRLETLVDRAHVVVAALDKAGDPTAVVLLERKLGALQEAETPEEKVVLVPQSTLEVAETIPFLSEDVDHDLYPFVRDLLAHELRSLSLTFAPSDIVTIMTANAAAAVGRSDQIGTIEPGKHADLVLIDGDPMTDRDAVLNVRVVLKAGRIVADHRP